MFLDSIVNSGSIPLLERVQQFAAQRHAVIVGNIANFTTPNYLQRDVPVKQFRAAMAAAVERRRERGTALSLDPALGGGGTVIDGPDGRLQVKTAASGGGVLFHDRNNRDLERSMQALVENATVYRVSTDLLRSRHAMLREAIGERV